MIFISHITVLGNHYARTTLVVKRSLNATFVVTPVPNSFQLEQPKLPCLYLNKKRDGWELAFDNDENWLSNDLINQMLEKLERKLQKIQKEQKN